MNDKINATSERTKARTKKNNCNRWTVFELSIEKCYCIWLESILCVVCGHMIQQSNSLIHITKICLFKYTEKLITANWKYSDKTSNIFHISAQNIDCGYSLEPPRRGGSNEYPQSMFLSRNKKNNVYPCKPQFYYIKMGFKGVKII